MSTRRAGIRSFAVSGLTKDSIEQCSRRLREGEECHRLLRHGHHPARQWHRQRAANCQPPDAPRQHRPRRVPALLRSVATPMSRATALSASPRFRTRRSLTAWSAHSAFARPQIRATTRSRRCRPSSRVNRRRSSASAAILPSPCPTRRRPSRACASWTLRSISPPSSTGRIS